MPGQCRKPQPVARLVANPADLAAQHSVVVSQYQELGILGLPTLGQHHQTIQQTAHKQVDGREDHGGTILMPTSRASRARAGEAGKIESSLT